LSEGHADYTATSQAGRADARYEYRAVRVLADERQGSFGKRKSRRIRDDREGQRRGNPTDDVPVRKIGKIN
jgi:hypothetical protein